MRVFWGTAGLCSLLILGNTAVATPAEAISITRRITVRATVAETIYIVTDARGGITQIVSNTPRDITPVVYVGRVKQGNGRSLTPKIYSAYRSIVPAGSNRMGVLYERTQLTPYRLVNINS